MVSTILIFDVDYFDVQVWGKERNISPSDLENKPFATLVNGYITSVNYAAKLNGLSRGRLREVGAGRKFGQLLTPPIIPQLGKHDTLVPRRASDSIYTLIKNELIMQLNMNYRPILRIEKGSKDEFYVDITKEIKNVLSRSPNYFSLRNQDFLERMIDITRCLKSFQIETKSKSLECEDIYTNVLQGNYSVNILPEHLAGAFFAAKVLRSIKQNLGWSVSGGVGSNKFLAKIACNRSKPNGLKVLSTRSWGRLKNEILFKEVPGLGGERGKDLRSIWPEVTTIADFLTLSKIIRQKVLGNDHHQIYRKCLGKDETPVIRSKFSPKGQTCRRKLKRPIPICQPVFENQQFLKVALMCFYELGLHLIYDYDRYGRLPKSITLAVVLNGCQNRRRSCIIRLEQHQMRCFIKQLKSAPLFDQGIWYENFVFNFERLFYKEYTDLMGSHSYDIKVVEVVAKY